MQPATLRRLLVFGVCVAGVGALYLAPSTARSPDQVSGPVNRHDLPTARPSVSTSGRTVAQVASTSTPAAAPTAPAALVMTSTTTTTATGRTGSAGPTTAPVARTISRTETTTPRRSGATAIDPGSDHVPPGPTGKPVLTAVDPQRLTVSWPAARDDVAVVSYKVWLNGFFVLATQKTSATLSWFNDTSTHVVQVRALDAAGNEGAAGPTLLVSRPAPEPTATRPSRPPAIGLTPSPAPSSPSATAATPGTDQVASSPTPDSSTDTEKDTDG